MTPLFATLILAVACVLCGVFLRMTDDGSEAECWWGTGFLTTLTALIVTAAAWAVVLVAAAF